MNQPQPIPNDQPHIADLVIEDTRTRKAMGLKKYGTPLQPHNGRNPLEDLYDELHDAVQYCKQELIERAELRARLAEAVAERDAFGGALSSLSGWLSCGGGNEGTTAVDYEERIRWGVDHIVKVETDRREKAESDRDELRRDLTAREHEASRMRDVIRETEHERELLERYGRDLDEIGRVMGCDHKDDGYLRCVTSELAKIDELRRALRKYGTHRNSCKAFPATSDEQIASDCDCGLHAALVARHAAPDVRGEEGKDGK